MQPVKEILIQNDAVNGVLLQDGTELRSKAVISNATPKITFLDLIPEVRAGIHVGVSVAVDRYSYSNCLSEVNRA